jgi:polyhydroxybutyrate depolymerase
VLVAHGYAMSAEGMVQITGYPALADQEGFAVAFLEGQTNRPPYHPTFAGPGPWNVGKNVRGPGHDVEGIADDLAYVKALTQDVATLQAIDERHVFLTGFSMGAYFTHHAGCALGAPWVRGLAPSGGSTYAFQDQCKQGPMPVILFHGTSDTVIGPSWGRQSRDEWTAKNGCSQEVDVVPILGGHCERHRGCPADGQVEMCFFDKMTHAWAGGTPAPIPQAEILASLTQVDPKAADLMRGIVEGVLAQDTAIRAMLTLLGDYPKLASIPGQFPLWHYTLSATAYASTAELSWRFWKKHAW